MIGIEQKRKLPTGWKWVKLEDIIDEIQSGFACGERDPKGVIQLRMNNVDTCGNFIWDEYIRIPAEKEVVEQYRLLEGDVVFNNTNSTELVGKSALFSGFEEPVVYSNHFSRIRTNQLLLPSILSSWLNYQWVKGAFSNICNRWIGQSAVKPNKLLSLDFPLPSLPEQKRIAGILARQMAAAAKAKRSCQKKLEVAEKLPASYLNTIFNSENAKQWPKRKLGDVCEVNPKRPSDLKAKPQQKTTFVPMPAVDAKEGIINKPEIKYFEEVQKGYTYFEENDVLFAKITPCMQNGKQAIARNLLNGFGFGTTEFHVIKPLEHILPEWIHSYIRQPHILYEAEQAFTGAVGQQRVPKDFLKTLEIPLPPLAEQKRIAKILTEQMAAAQKVTKTIKEELELINKLPASLLQQAFKGGI